MLAATMLPVTVAVMAVDAGVSLLILLAVASTFVKCAVETSAITAASCALVVAAKNSARNVLVPHWCTTFPMMDGCCT